MRKVADGGTVEKYATIPPYFGNGLVRLFRTGRCCSPERQALEVRGRDLHSAKPNLHLGLRLVLGVAGSWLQPREWYAPFSQLSRLPVPPLSLRFGTLLLHWQF